MVTFRASSLLIVLFVGMSIVGAQTSPKKPTKTKPIRATVTVMGSGDVDAPKLPDESNWSELSLAEHGLTILFPGKSDDIKVNSVGPVETYSVTSTKASYTLATRSVGSVLDPNDIQSVLDETIDNAFDPASTKFLFRRPISYEGRIGREFALLDKERRTEFRIFLLDSKLFIISVAVNQKDYDQGFDKWVQKFFESFAVKVQMVEA
ncbi:MAG: hypothetical protein KF881_08305 [Acidobacteria bacterium]|nr:hypothetical protein [Acidobacteriota bacterium]